MVRTKIVYIKGKKTVIKDFNGMSQILPGRKAEGLKSKDYDLLIDHAKYLQYKYVDSNFTKRS